MKDHEIDWEDTLLGASERVQRVVAKVASQGERPKELRRGASGDITLLADGEAERVLISNLLKVAKLKVLSEEAGEVGEKNSDLTAILDPVDGSSNFSRGIPFYCTSAAIVEGERLEGVRWAVVRNLVTGDAYFAERGKGAKKNGGRIRTSGTRELKDAIAAVDLSRGGARMVRRLTPVLAAAKRCTHLGANALEMCLLAEGAVDTCVDIRDSMRVVDFAAAYLIAKEAGAVVTPPEGGRLVLRLNLKSRFSYVASANQELHREVLVRLARK